MMTIQRLAAALAATGILAATLTGCGDDAHHEMSPSTIPESEDHNQQDVDFATAMIQHHAQALAMVDLTVDRDISADLMALAEQIQLAQTPEIELMVDWLNEWDQPIPATVRDHVNGGHGGDHGGTDDHSADGMPGMMSADQMSALADAPDDEFEDLWLTMMIEHHEGAVTMAEDEIADGEDAAARDLARDIIEAQQGEIDQMEEMLG